MPSQLSEDTKKLFISKYALVGQNLFYSFLINYATNKVMEKKDVSPEIELLNYYDRFLFLYREENKEIYLEIAKVFRRAAHKIYRALLNKKKTARNKRFLNLVK